MNFKAAVTKAATREIVSGDHDGLRDRGKCSKRLAPTAAKSARFRLSPLRGDRSFVATATRSTRNPFKSQALENKNSASGLLKQTECGVEQFVEVC
jgi:hypothetical protein